jgi:hypothetical protein
MLLYEYEALWRMGLGGLRCKARHGYPEARPALRFAVAALACTKSVDDSAARIEFGFGVA